MLYHFWGETMIILHADLDNTIIYSYKHDMKMPKRCVEWYHGREISYVTEKTFEYLKRLTEKMLIVPTSTRTAEQYKRIDLGVGAFPYALVCNGGILLKNGVSDDQWYRDSVEMVQESIVELQKSMKSLRDDPRRIFELRFIEDLFVFTKCNEPEKVVDDLIKKLDITKVNVFHNGAKVYVVPRKLSKGMAIRRFKNDMNPDLVIAAGDSEFDISMLKEADIGLAPHGFAEQYHIDFEVREAGEKTLFSESFLRTCLEIKEAEK